MSWTDPNKWLCSIVGYRLAMIQFSCSCLFLCDLCFITRIITQFCVYSTTHRPSIIFQPEYGWKCTTTTNAHFETICVPKCSLLKSLLTHQRKEADQEMVEEETEAPAIGREHARALSSSNSFKIHPIIFENEHFKVRCISARSSLVLEDFGRLKKTLLHVS